MQNSKLFEYVGPGLQAQSREIMKWVSAIKDLRSPDFGSETSTFLSEVQHRCGFFATETAVDSEKKEVQLRGAKAVQAWLDQLQVEIDKGGKGGGKQALLVRKIKSRVLPADEKMKFDTMHKEVPC